MATEAREPRKRARGDRGKGGRERERQATEEWEPVNDRQKKRGGGRAKRAKGDRGAGGAKGSKRQ